MISDGRSCDRGLWADAGTPSPARLQRTRRVRASSVGDASGDHGARRGALALRLSPHAGGLWHAAGPGSEDDQPSQAF
eukprot:3817565-Prymnesium_polylepis.2